MKTRRLRDDQREGAELVVQKDDQGDFYIGTGPEGVKMIPNCIRLCASGGEFAHNRKLRAAVIALWEALEKPE